MALSRLDNLYRQVILDHSSHPHHKGVLDTSTSKIELNNPTCGDVIQLQLQVEDNRIKDVKFTGSGCSISTASASMMCDAIIGHDVNEALDMVASFSELVQGQEVSEIELLGDAAMLQGVSKFPARIKCATLAWKALEKALDDEEQTAVAGQPHCES